MRILRRPRSKQEAEQLIEEVNESNYIGHFSEDDMEELIESDSIRFFYDEADDELVGFGAWEEIDEEWVEVGPFFTRLKFRGQGMGRFMIDTVFELNRRRNLFAVTKNDLIRKMFTRHGFSTVALVDLPRAIILHQWRRMTLRRMWNLIAKFRFQRTSYLVRPKKPDDSG